MTLTVVEPDVTSAVLLLVPAQLAPHCIDVSDCQAVRSHDDRPILPDIVYADSPIRDPYTVTLADPVDTLLPRDVTLALTTSADSPWLELPTRIPDDTYTRRLPATACPT